MALPMDTCGDTLPPGTHGPSGRDNAFPSTCGSGSRGTRHRAVGGTGRPLGKTFFLLCQRRHPELPKIPTYLPDRQKKKEHGKSNLHAEEDFLQKFESLNLDPRLKKLLLDYEEVFGALLPFLSCKKLVQMDLKRKPEFEKTRVRRRSYPAPQEQVEEIERQIQECIDAALVEENKKGDYPHHCSPCFLVAKPGWTALRLVVDYGEVNKKIQNHSGSIPNMENTLERIVKCRYKT